MVSVLLAALVLTMPQTAVPVTPAPMATPEPVVPAPAVSPSAMESDARCLAAFAMLVSGTNAQTAQTAKLGSLFFYGKLVGRNPAIDLSAELVRAATAVSADSRSDLTRCSGELQAAGGAMTAAGSRLGAAR